MEKEVFDFERHTGFSRPVWDIEDLVLENGGSKKERSKNR